MIDYENKIKQIILNIQKHFDIIIKEELTLYDIIYYDEEIIELIQNIKELHKEIIETRQYNYLEQAEKDIRL